MKEENLKLLFIFFGLIAVFALGYLGGHLDNRELLKECYEEIGKCEIACLGQNPNIFFNNEVLENEKMVLQLREMGES